jgi:zinc ribbon protein
MFLFIGVFPRERELAVARFHCERCLEDADQHLIETGSRLWLFFIPLFTFSRRYVVVCSHCGAVTEATREFAKRAADLARHGQPER